METFHFQTLVLLRGEYPVYNQASCHRIKANANPKPTAHIVTKVSYNFTPDIVAAVDAKVIISKRPTQTRNKMVHGLYGVTTTTTLPRLLSARNTNPPGFQRHQGCCR